MAACSSGLNGVVIKSHGGTDAEGFASAVDVGYDMVAIRSPDQDRSDTLNRDGGALQFGAAASQEAIS